jgi:quinol monooxygenase YgiN
VTLEARAGKETELAEFLAGAVALVDREPATTSWFGIRIDGSRFAIFDAFPHDAAREAHLTGAVAEALLGKVDELLAAAPTVEKVDVLAAKLR